jgi:acyl carrier protein
MPAEELLAALQQALDRDEGVVTIADVDWRQFVTGFTAARDRPLLRDLPDAREGLAAGDPEPVAEEAGVPPLAERLAAMSRPERDRALVGLVRAEVAGVLGHSSPESVELGQSFLDMGVDSATSVQLRNRIGAAAGLRLPATVVFDHPTVRELAGYLGDRLAPAPAEPTGATDTAPADAPADPAGADAPAAGDLDDAGLDELVDILDAELDRP